MVYDVAIIGGGAAGLCAAVRLRQKNPKHTVILLEQLPRVGKKLILTGNGRCNITNREITPQRYHGAQPDFCRYALTRYGVCETQEFFLRLGVVFAFDKTGRAYPASYQASSVVDALRFAADEFGVVTMTDTRVTGISRINGGFDLETDRERITARTVLAAAGLLSGGERLGSDGKVLRIFKERGYRTVKTSPAIVQLKTAEQTVRSLKGIKVNAVVTLARHGQPLRSEYGEVLFCDYGLSGPPVLQVAREAGRSDAGLTVCLDLVPEHTSESLLDMLKRRSSDLSGRTFEEFFTGMLNKRVGQTILKNCGLKLSDRVNTLCPDMLKTVAAAIKCMCFTVTGTTGFVNSQVTAGGLDTNEFDPHTMMSRLDAGLFAAGELLDIDGDCGGFNLQWAWSSALCAADGILTFLGEKT